MKTIKHKPVVLHFILYGWEKCVVVVGELKLMAFVNWALGKIYFIHTSGASKFILPTKCHKGNQMKGEIGGSEMCIQHFSQQV
jgi:hypothetical protein